MPSLCRISFLVRPRLLGEPGRSLIWILPLCSTHHLESRISLGVLTPFCSLVIVDLPAYNPECVQLGSPFGVCTMTLDVPSLLMLLYWICHPFCTLPGSSTRLLNSIVWSLLAF